MAKRIFNGLRLAAEAEVPRPEGALDPRVLDYVRYHRDELNTSREEVPTRFRDIDSLQGPPEATSFLLPSLMSGSDYGGSAVEVANYRLFMQKFGEVSGVFPLIGTHNSFGVAIRLNALSPEMLDVLDELDSDSPLDDDAVSEIENEAVDAAWADWASHDFANALEGRFPAQEEVIQSMSVGELRTLFNHALERGSAQWVHESGNSAFIDVEIVASKVREEDLQAQGHDARKEPVAADGASPAKEAAKKAAKFNHGDRVRCTFPDPYSGIRERAEGTVVVVATPKGKSVYPDPSKKLLMVKWDDGQQASVPVGNVERISQGKAIEVKPFTLLRHGTEVGQYKTLAEAEHASGIDPRRMYSQGFIIREMTHAQLEKARYPEPGKPQTVKATGEPVKLLRSAAGKQSQISQIRGDDFKMAFVEAALFSELDLDGEPLDRNYTIDNFSEEALNLIVNECDRFQSAVGDLIVEENLVYASRYSATELAGHDFLLTRNGHGAGFWDGEWAEPAASRLDEEATGFGNLELYIGDDDQIHASR